MPAEVFYMVMEELLPPPKAGSNIEHDYSHIVALAGTSKHLGRVASALFGEGKHAVDISIFYDCTKLLGETIYARPVSGANLVGHSTADLSPRLQYLTTIIPNYKIMINHYEYRKPGTDYDVRARVVRVVDMLRNLLRNSAQVTNRTISIQFEDQVDYKKRIPDNHWTMNDVGLPQSWGNGLYARLQ